MSIEIGQKANLHHRSLRNRHPLLDERGMCGEFWKREGERKKDCEAVCPVTSVIAGEKAERSCSSCRAGARR